MGSPFYARIKRDVLSIVSAIPPGRVATFAAIGAHLDVMPRHVAYILATLDPLERETVPWHRAVAGDGTLGPAKRGARGAEQRERLAAEGVAFDAGGTVVGFADRTVPIADLAGVPAFGTAPRPPKPHGRGRRGVRGDDT